ncbi:2-oxo acid dehydrogenase subunit E2 [Halovenus sp. WSH3]|uniref:2-oxo acid dehydrogenase subunit E2 n=1 Tax=Halovenus carboxidivorans TaxID=2692199 RepID=A0A6B0T8C8_9EURY|nr:dihydrolipoamide acetyltransferase family protein [Halovenus carboxidivorans]MXR51873.1 2-oxo acid dehydrogenase subunit E2 [Halovenus carboxidivorans]
MAFEYELPDVGEGVAEGEIVAWHVSVGDHVDEDEVLAEIETDKAVVDLPSPVAGTIQELHAEEGDVVPVRSVVVTIDVDGGTDDAEGTADASGEPEAGSGGETATEAAGSEEPSVADGRVFAPPNVRRLARELGVEITAVDGSGPSGRITEADVRAAAEGDDEGTTERSDGEETTGRERTSSGDGQRKSAVKRRSDTERRSATGRRTNGESASADAADRERTLAVPATRKVAREHEVDIDEVPTEKERDGEAFVEPEDIERYVEARESAEVGASVESAEASAEGRPAETTAESEVTAESTAAGTGDRPVSTEPYRGIRRTIGTQMQTSSQTIPHATHHDTATVDDLVEARAELKPRAEDRGISLTYMPFVLKALVAGLKEYPIMNTELDEEAEEILYKEYYNVGIAVATDAGLMVPVVENVDQKGLLDLASEVNELAEKARNREIAPAEMRGGTFTVTNFGAIGGEYATPIINHPETGILGLGAIEQRPVAENGEVVARETLPLSLSIDHRVIDGAEAAQFTNTVIEYLENPTLLLLE